jgi:hypothetical protein
MDVATKAWYYLTVDGEETQTHGPFDIATMKSVRSQATARTKKCSN